MKQKSKNSALITNSRNQVQVFSSLAEMKFKPANENGSQVLAKNKQKLLKKNK